MPVSAYIIFEEEDNKILALKNRSNKIVLGKVLKFKDASEPTDIIWENRHFTKANYFKRQAIAYIIMAFLLFGSFLLVYRVALFSSKIANTYPQIDCDTVIKDYGNTIETYAYEDWKYIDSNPGKRSSGTLQCFCQQQEDEIGRSKAKETMYPVNADPEN